MSLNRGYLSLRHHLDKLLEPLRRYVSMAAPMHNHQHLRPRTTVLSQAKTTNRRSHILNLGRPRSLAPCDFDMIIMGCSNRLRNCDCRFSRDAIQEVREIWNDSRAQQFERTDLKDLDAVVDRLAIHLQEACEVLSKMDNALRDEYC